MIEWTKLENAPRILLEAELVPAQGDRFQPSSRTLGRRSIRALVERKCCW
jgi:hypothetical protein